MKKILLFGLLGLMGLTGFKAQAQTLVDNYRFDTYVDAAAWIDITGMDSALVTPPASGWITSGGLASQLTDIGFTFPFAGTDYTTFGTNFMGAVRLGARIVGTQSGSNILATASTLPKVDGLGVRGAVDSSCYIRCATVGTAGNRVLVVEYRLGIYQHVGTYVCWQTQLFETTGEVRLVYGPSEATSQMPATQPGLAMSNSDMLFLDMANHSMQRLISTPVPVNDVGVWPEEWRYYSFIPDSTVCPAPPTLTVLNNNPDSAAIGWSARGGVSWRLCIPALGIDMLTTDTVLLLGSINPATVYSGSIQTVCSVDDSSLRVLPFTFTTDCGTVHLLPWVDDFELAADNDCWLNPYKTLSYRWRRESASDNYYMRTGYNTSAYAVYNEWLITPPMVLPNTEGLTLSWDYKSEQFNGNSPKVRVLLLVCDTTDAVDTTDAWVALDTIEDFEQDFQSHHLLLDAYAGHRVRVAYQRYGNGGRNAYIDNVGMEVLTAPDVALQVPGDVNVDDTTVVVAQLTAGLLSNPQYQWSSSMADRGEALLVSASDTLKIVYQSAGWDTVSVTLTTDYGSDTATASYKVCGPITTIPWHEGFENGFTCWEMPTSGLNVWTLQNTGAHSGQRMACAKNLDVYNPFDTMVSQPIVVPADAHGLTLLWWMRHDGSAPSYFRHILVKALDADHPSWNTADTLFYRNSNDIPTTWQQFSIDLEPLAGQTVRFAWEGSAYISARSLYIDDIEIRYTREPVGSLATSAAMVYEGDTITATATLTEGDTVGINYQWESTMANLGLATLLGSGPQVRIAYNGTGIDTVVITVSNNYNSFTDTAIVRVCSVQDTLPWVANFSNDFPCWQVLEGTCEVHSSGYLSFTGWPTTVATPPVYIPTDGNVVLEYDYAYYFFYGSTQVMVTTDMITFDTIGEFPFTTGTHPSTRIPLNAYAGQHIRVVFKATGQFIQYYLIYMNIHYAMEPMVQIVADDGYFPGTPVTLVASLLEGDTTGITYTWTSTKALNGEATLTQDGSAQATLTPVVGGPDTVIVVATNNYGSNVAWVVVDIKPCDTVEALQWTEDFSNHYTCWWLPEGSLWTLPDEPSVTVALAIDLWQPADSWLVSRAITLPSLPVGGNDELLLCWDATTQINDTHSYCVMITTAPDYRNLSAYDTLIAYDTVLPDVSAGWSTLRVPLSAYAGQTVHLAFRYTTELYEPNGLPGILIIDNIRIIDTTGFTPPPAPDTVWRTVTVNAVMNNGSQQDDLDEMVHGAGTYMDGDTVTLEGEVHGCATSFVYWITTEGDTLFDNPYTFIIHSDVTLTAVFAIFGGIDDVEGTAFTLHPNPAHDEVTVSVSQPSTLTVLDMAGREVIPPTPVTSELRIPTSGLPAGVYFVRIGEGVKKLIVR